MDKSLRQEVSQFLSLADFMCCEVIIGIKLTPDGQMIWATNGMKMKEKLLTEGLRFDAYDDFYEETVIKNENFIDDFVDAEFKNDNVAEDLEVYPQTQTREKSFKCLQCSKSFKRSWHLKRHLRTHIGEEECLQCQKCFADPGDPDNDCQTHTGEKPLKCRQHSKSLVKREKKPLKCSQCSKSFRDSYALQTHLRIHTGEKPFKCSHCSKYFRTPYNLKVHVATHSGEKPFQCSQCSKFFRNSRSLKLHLLTHTSERPFKCLQCSKSFSVAQALKVHIRIHTGEKPFDCLQCSKSFSRAFDLKLHIRTHTGDKPFKCPQCPKCYVTSYKLKRHLGTHTEMLTQMFQKTIYPPNSSENGKTTLSDDAIKGLSRQYINGGQRGPEAATAANGDHETSADRPSHHPPLQAILGQDSSSTVTSLGAPAAGLMRNSISKTQRFNPMAPPTGLYGSAPAMANDPNIGHTLFVYNIGAETTEIDLYTLFGPFGAIIKVHIQRDLSTGAEKDLGVVTFGDYNDASLAVQAMNGYPCEKNALKPLQVFFKTNKSK